MTENPEDHEESARRFVKWTEDFFRVGFGRRVYSEKLLCFFGFLRFLRRQFSMGTQFTFFGSRCIRPRRRLLNALRFLVFWLH